MKKLFFVLMLCCSCLVRANHSLSIHDNPFGYDGAYQEGHGIPLLYLNARYLHLPQGNGTAYFIERDSLGETAKKGALFDNRYNAFAGNPIMNQDPSGHISDLGIGLITTAATLGMGLVTGGCFYCIHCFRNREGEAEEIMLRDLGNMAGQNQPLLPEAAQAGEEAAQAGEEAAQALVHPGGELGRSISAVFAPEINRMIAMAARRDTPLVYEFNKSNNYLNVYIHKNDSKYMDPLVNMYVGRNNPDAFIAAVQAIVAQRIPLARRVITRLDFVRGSLESVNQESATIARFMNNGLFDRHLLPIIFSFTA